MFVKYVIFAFLAVFAFQGVVEANTISHPIQRNLSDDLVKLISKLKQFITTTINDAVHKVKELILNLKNIVANLIEKAKAKLQEELLNIMSGINMIKEQAIELGVDVSECNAAHKEEIEEMKKKIIAEIIDCASRQIEDAQAIIDLIVTDIKTIMSIVTRIKDKSDECGFNPICYSALIKEAYNLFVELPSRIRQYVRNASDLILSIQSEVPKCLSTKIFKFIAAAEPVVTIIGKCMYEKIEQIY